MIVTMSQVEVLGRRSDLDGVLRVLQHLQTAQLVEPGAIGGADASRVPTFEADRPAASTLDSTDGTVITRLEALLDLLPETLQPDDNEWTQDCSAADPIVAVGKDSSLEDVGLQRLEWLDDLEQQVGQLRDSVVALRDEEESLRHHVSLLGQLELLLPDLARLTDDELALLGLATLVLVLDDPTGQLVSAVERELDERLAGRYLLVHTASGQFQTDSNPSAVGCLLVVARQQLIEVEQLLGADHITHVDVPDAYASQSLHSTVTHMRRSLGELPDQRAGAERDLAALAPGRSRSSPGRALRDELVLAAERRGAVDAADLTPRTFGLRLWVPRAQVSALTRSLPELVGAPVVVAKVSRRDVVGTPPVLLHNRRPWAPYQKLVGFLSWPTPGTLDPTGLMALMLPFLFGVMVGDIAYGAALAGIGWWARRHWPDKPLLDDAGRFLMVGGAWSVVFGVLFGEALGSLGNKLGLPALWFYRGGPAALEPLLLFALAIGATHIVLGLVLGLVLALRHHQRVHAMERSGTLLVLIGLFLLAGTAATWLPDGLVTPAVAAVVIGLVVCSIPHGLMGLLLGPLEVLGTVGNVLSYLRVAAVGLASVYLANVANELAATAPLLLGIVVAAFFHILNLALAAFSPTVQSLRLHYVEFFSKFHDGQGQLFTPLGGSARRQPPLPPAPPATPGTLLAPAAETADRASTGFGTSTGAGDVGPERLATSPPDFEQDLEEGPDRVSALPTPARSSATRSDRIRT